MRNIVQDGAKKVNPRAGKCAIIPLVLHTREGENLNESTHTQSRRKRRIGWLIFAAVFLAAVVGVWLYLSDYYHADKTAVAALQDTAPEIELRQSDTRIDFIPRAPQAGLIFYPGGKVSFEAYAPLMQACAERGILCVLLDMPGNLAVLDPNAADGIAASYPEIDRWYIGGHSLGGVMAASYVSKHADAFAGLVLLGAYSTADLAQTELRVLSVYGSEDGVMDRERYDSCRANLPSDTTEIVIQGGCHAYFGSYGAQDGDGTPTITNEEQITRTADAIADLAASK